MENSKNTECSGRNTFLYFVSGLFIGVALVGIGLKMDRNNSQNNDDEAVFKPIRSINSNYHFTNPLVGFDFFDKKNFEPLKPLEKKVDEIIKQKKQRKLIDNASFYFRELGNGRWVGINQDNLFAPRSLLKVPIMIAYFKYAETRPKVLSKKIFYDPDETPIQPPLVIKPNRYYTVFELIQYMIIYSDNAAKELLIKNIDPNLILEVFTDLGVSQYTGGIADEYRISAKQYSIFFRVLYNSTFLRSQMSEQALRILSEVDYKNGLVAGLPSSVQTAHKYGERVMREKDTDAVNGFELHDCGIVYYPQQTYFLCVMTQGSDLENLEKTIGELSKLTYEYEKNEYEK